MLEELKLLCGVQGSQDDPLLQLLLDMAQRMVLDYCNLETLPEGLSGAVLRIASGMYAGRSHQGLTALSEGDISITYAQQEFGGIPADLRGQLNGYRTIKWQPS